MKNRAYNIDYRINFLKCLFCILVVMLHGPRFVPEYLYRYVRIITSVAVPGFFAISGYLLFYRKEYNYRTVLKIALKYFSVFIFWSFIYCTYYWKIAGGGNARSYIKFLLIHSDGYHLWYIKVLIETLIVYPIIIKITQDKKLVIFYSALYLIFVSGRFTLTIFPNVNDAFIRIVQLPLFQISGYIGGTAGAFFPAEFLGIMIVGGSIVNGLVKGVILKKYLIISLIMFGSGMIMSIFHMRYQIALDASRFDYSLQPLHLHVLLMTCGVIVFFFYMSHLHINSEKIKVVINKASELTLGVYVIHGMVKFALTKFVGGAESNRINFVIFLLMIIVSGIVVAAARRIIPKKYHGWII